MELTVTNVTIAAVGFLFSIGSAYGIVKTKINGFAKELKKKKEAGECNIQTANFQRTLDENKKSHGDFYAILGANSIKLTKLETKQDSVLEILNDMQNNRRKRNGD